MRAVLDLRTAPIREAVLNAAGAHLGTTLDRGGLVFGGEDGATCGTRTARGTWARLQHRRLGDTAGSTEAAWTAEETAATLTGVRKPAWHRAATWYDHGLQWRVDEVDAVDSPVLGTLTGLHPHAQLTESWWHTLRTSLSALGTQHTTRRGLGQDAVTHHIARTIETPIDTTVTEWATCHGDLHWGNITADAHLLDWEGWGYAPRGLDAATLWGMALPHPAIAARLRRELADDLDTRTGRIMQLMWCATALRATARRPDLAAFAAPARTEAARLLRELA